MILQLSNDMVYEELNPMLVSISLMITKIIDCEYSLK